MFSSLASKAFAIALCVGAAVQACDLHQHVDRGDVPYFSLQGSHGHRADVLSALNPHAEVTERDWNYTDSAHWGDIKPEYNFCKTGQQQSPINLLRSYGLASTHKPTFVDYDRNVTGDLFNWGFGPSFTSYGHVTSQPQLHFDGRILYFVGAHMHFPSEHLIDGKRTKGELHLVHADASGKPAAVIGLRIDVDPSKVSHRIPQIPSHDSKEQIHDCVINPYIWIQETSEMKHYWTYEGSLTTPPCDEGLRWFVPREVLYLSEEYMEALLESNGGVYSSRVVQAVKKQHVNV